MAFTITFDLTRAGPAQPSLDAIEDIVNSSVQPHADRKLVSNLLNAGPTSAVFTFPDPISAVTVANVANRCKLEFGLLGRVSEVVAPPLAASLTYTTSDVPGHGQPV